MVLGRRYLVFEIVSPLIYDVGVQDTKPEQTCRPPRLAVSTKPTPIRSINSPNFYTLCLHRSWNGVFNAIFPLPLDEGIYYDDHTRYFAR